MNITKILKEHDFLKKGLAFVLKNSTSNFNPYHNINHNLTVLYFSYYAAKLEDLNKDETKELLIAALFHDYDHSGGKTTDDKNIEKAKDGVTAFIKKDKVDVDIQNIFDIMDATEFPYKKDTKDLSTQQKIIRDADLMQLFEDNRIQCNILGLQNETGRTLKGHLKAQKEFIDGVKFETKAGKLLKKKFWKDIEEELDMLIDII